MRLPCEHRLESLSRWTADTDTLSNVGVNLRRKRLGAKSQPYVRTPEVCPKRLRRAIGRTRVMMREYEWSVVET